MNRKSKHPHGNCPCGSGKDYKACCKAFHKRHKRAETAEKLMRSRYCAYVKDNLPYLLETWHESTRPDDLQLDRSIKWLGLEVLSSADGMESDLQGTVTFTAHYEREGLKGSMTEISEFLKVSGQWQYYRARNPLF